MLCYLVFFFLIIFDFDFDFDFDFFCGGLLLCLIYQAGGFSFGGASFGGQLRFWAIIIFIYV